MKRILYLVLAFLPGTVFGQVFPVYTVDPTAQNKVKVVGSTPIHQFEGTTGAITGTLTLVATTYDRADFTFEVPLDSLNTGIDARDNKMRSSVLETKLYPTAVFKGSVLRTLGQYGSETDVTANGDLTIHGVTNPCMLNAEITEDRGQLTITSRLKIKLSDYKMDRPAILFIRVDDEIVISVEIHMRVRASTN